MNSDFLKQRIIWEVTHSGLNFENKNVLQQNDTQHHWTHGYHKKFALGCTPFWKKDFKFSRYWGSNILMVYRKNIWLLIYSLSTSRDCISSFSAVNVTFLTAFIFQNKYFSKNIKGISEYVDIPIYTRMLYGIRNYWHSIIQLFYKIFTNLNHNLLNNNIIAE